MIYFDKSLKYHQHYPVDVCVLACVTKVTSPVITVCHVGYGKCSKISNSFLFLLSINMFVFWAAIHKMLIRIANMVCLGLFWQSTSV